MRGKKLFVRQRRRARSRNKVVAKGKPLKLTKYIRVEQPQSQTASL